MSLPYIATFCEMEGVENCICAILGKYSQSHNDDWIQNASPFADLPYGRMDFWRKIPRVFYKNEKDYQDKKCFLPKLEKVTDKVKEIIYR